MEALTITGATTTIVAEHRKASTVEVGLEVSDAAILSGAAAAIRAETRRPDAPRAEVTVPHRETESQEEVNIFL